jgi:hypothetical protein
MNKKCVVMHGITHRKSDIYDIYKTSSLEKDINHAKSEIQPAFAGGRFP